ncbi:hypothetical protein GCM10012282_75100 [Streptomyces lacrimifluminis]|uniref:Lipoprotein n=2 Tax=Streptomyces lacrimifluminis TaxID=1500077 RepID=A0A917P907_9ACTN|nr:hypothetical protein GCM10012282_75100 [Streptomyces lacrimifluminis]
MTSISASIRAFAHAGRILAGGALAALALTGCGNDELSGSGPQDERGMGADSTVSATPSAAEKTAFAAMLDEVAQPCSSPDAPVSAPGPTDKKPTGSAGKQSLASGEPLPSEPIEPGAPTEPEAELNDRDGCASVQHEQRILQALQSVSEPTPAKVRKALNGLGYIDERIHGLQQDGKATRFHLDLREKGGRLCEAGLAAGVESDVTVCTTSHLT